MKAVIFAGGVGSRLWPLSRKKSPKQFERIIGDKSTLQLMVDRLTPEFKPEDIFISTGKQYKDIIETQLPQIPTENIIVEPEMRDVAAAVGLITGIFAKIAPDEPMAILWADHLIKDINRFKLSLQTAGELLAKSPEKIVILGHKPRFANENLGWIALGEKRGEVNGVDYFSLGGFKYRPTKEVAQNWFESGKYAWNLGYWVAMPRFLWSLYKRNAPEMHAQLSQIQEAYGTLNWGSVLREVYPKIEKIHFDNVIPEHLSEDEAVVLSEDLGWSDLGAWEALKEALQPSQADVVTKGTVIVKDSHDSLVYNYQDKTLIVGVDLEDMVIVNTGDVILVGKKTSMSKVKKLVEGFAGGEFEHLT